MATSVDGWLTERVRGPEEEQFVQIFTSNPDLEYADSFRLPRHGAGVILYALDAVFAQNYPNLSYDITQYGKPLKNTFDFAKKRLLS